MLQLNKNYEIEHLLNPDALLLKNIVIAEDDEKSYLQIKEYLDLTKANIIWTRNAQDTLKLIESNNQIDIVLMNKRMPGMNDYKTLIIIRQIRPDIPIIAISTCVYKSNIKKEGFNDYLVKPFTRKDLLNTILKFIS